MFDVLDKYMHMESVNDFCKESNLCSFIILLVVSYQETLTCAINHLLRIDLSWLNNCMIVLGGSVLGNKNRKHKSSIM